MRQFINFESDKAIVIRAEHFRKFAAEKIDGSSSVDVELLKKMPLYFICSRRDLMIDREKIDKVVEINNIYTVPLFYLNHLSKPVAFNLEIPSSIFSGTQPSYITIHPLDDRTLVFFSGGRHVEMNIGINPLIRQLIPIEHKLVNIEYIGLSEASGITGRFKNGHLGYESVLTSVSSKRKSEDVFIVGYNFKIKSSTENPDVEAIEASLISYLKPEFNTMLVDFPEKDGPAIVKRLTSAGYEGIRTTIYTTISLDDKIKIEMPYKSIHFPTGLGENVVAQIKF